jgi:hypothetical protein
VKLLPWRWKPFAHYRAVFSTWKFIKAGAEKPETWPAQWLAEKLFCLGTGN